MLSTAVQTILALVAGLLPELGAGSTSAVAKVLSALQIVVPILAAEASALLEEVEGVIAALRNGATPLTKAQIDQLVAMEAQIDAAFDADANAAGAAPTPDP